MNRWKYVTAVMTVSAATLLLAGCSAGKSSGGDVTIDLESLTTEPVFIEAKSGKTELEYIAMLDEGGNLRLSYNTCQSCNGSPAAYFVYEDGIMTCQNCGLTFDKSVVGTAAQGCNPILVEDYEIQDGQVVISSASVADAAKTYFTNWRNNAK